MGEDDILPYEIGDEASDAWNYNEWHISQTYNADAELDEYVTFNECSVSFNEDPRGPEHVIPILKGYDIDARPTTANTGDVSEWVELIETIEIDVISGEVTLQLPLFMYWNGDLEDVGFTTVRNEVPFGPGVHTFTGVDLTESYDLIADETPIVDDDEDAGAGEETIAPTPPASVETDA